MNTYSSNQQVSESSVGGHGGCTLLRIGIMLAMFVAALTLFVKPVAAHADHNAAQVSAAALNGLVLDEQLCGPGGYRIDGTELCTHGADNAVTDGEIAQAAAIQSVTSAHAILCDGDGVSGQRVQVMYVRAEDQADGYATYVDSIRTWAADADAIYDASAHQTGGHRHIRFVTNEDCQIDVLNIVIPANADDSFQATVSALRALGYSDPSRKYMLFVQANVYCGIASVVNDDSPGANNRSNALAGYARIDSDCWDGLTAAHELTHTLGGVQNSAPNSTGAWHCVDENDVMCYSDYPYFPAVRYECTASQQMSLLDCNHDDYFSTNPPAGSYLATHWNVADSAFLIQVDRDDHAALPYLALTASVDDAVVAEPMAITFVVTAPTTVDAANLIQRIEFYEGETLLATVNDGAHEIVWQATTPGVYSFSAKVFDYQDAVIILDGMTITVVPASHELAADFGVEQVIMLPLVMN